MVALSPGLKLAAPFIMVPTVRISGATKSQPQTPVWPAKRLLYLLSSCCFCSRYSLHKYWNIWSYLRSHKASTSSVQVKISFLFQKAHLMLMAMENTVTRHPSVLCVHCILTKARATNDSKQYITPFPLVRVTAMRDNCSANLPTPFPCCTPTFTAAKPCIKWQN